MSWVGRHQLLLLKLIPQPIPLQKPNSSAMAPACVASLQEISMSLHITSLPLPQLQSCVQHPAKDLPPSPILSSSSHQLFPTPAPLNMSFLDLTPHCHRLLPALEKSIQTRPQFSQQCLMDTTLFYTCYPYTKSGQAVPLKRSVPNDHPGSGSSGSQSQIVLQIQ